jgi:hypothetical protein
MGTIRKKYPNRPDEQETALRALDKQEKRVIDQISSLETASLRSLRAVTVKGKTKAPDDVQYLTNYEEQIAEARTLLAEIRSRREALLNPVPVSDGPEGNDA